jgi:2-polyprenyl-3-methyl-5-hydroxy-6-metoxy-1,4-benzoquinol methylase
MSSRDIIALYERLASEYDHDRSRTLVEKDWLDRFLRHVPPGGTVLDLGCGMGEPIAQYILSRGYRIVGCDSSPSLITLCRARFPNAEWLVADMRELALDRRFDGLIAWDSFFHLSMDDQRSMIVRFADHTNPDAPLMFTSGSRAGESVGTYHGEPLYHASLDPTEYRRLLERHGFTVQAYQPDDADCGGRTVWLATRGRSRVG